MLEREFEQMEQQQVEKKDADTELGYLNLMFGTGPNNMKLQEMTEEAIQYVEREMNQKNNQDRSPLQQSATDEK